MPDIDGVVRLEEQLDAKRKQVGAELKAERDRRGLTLQEVGDAVGLHKSQVMLIERAESWRTSTVQRVVRFFEGAQQNSRSRARPTV